MAHTAVSDTSIKTYHAIKADGTLTLRQGQVMEVIYPGQDYSLQELVKLTGLPVNVISGRCNELRTAGSLTFGLTRKCSVTQRTIHPVKLPAAQESLF